MKKKIKVVEHGTLWIDPNPTPVIICPECGSEELFSKIYHNTSYKNFLIVKLERDGICRRCKNCDCVFEVDSDVIIETRPSRIALAIFLISLIVIIVLLYFASDYRTAEEIPGGLILGILGTAITMIISLSYCLALL